MQKLSFQNLLNTGDALGVAEFTQDSNLSKAGLISQKSEAYFSPSLIDLLNNHYKIRPICGVPFTDDQSSALLSSAVTDLDNLLSDEQIRELSTRVDEGDRISTGLASSAVYYSGAWYYQGLDSTCVPMSLANAGLVLGFKIDPEPFAKMLNLCCDKGEDLKGGTTYKAIGEICDHYGLKGFSLSPIDFDNRLREFNRVTGSSIFQKMSLDGQGTFESLKLQQLRDFYVGSELKVISNNGRVIKDHLDNQKLLLVTLAGSLTGVSSGLPKNNSEYHAVCISGYRISDSGFMDIQILDSQHGKYWVTLEQLSSSIYWANTEVVSKK